MRDSESTSKISEIYVTWVWTLIPRFREKIFMKVDLIINIASETLTSLYNIAFITGLAIIKQHVFLKDYRDDKVVLLLLLSFMFQ